MIVIEHEFPQAKKEHVDATDLMLCLNKHLYVSS